jgi:hypothetical protein
MTHPCASGLAPLDARDRRPERLFGFLDGTADGAPGSDTGSSAHGVGGLPSAISLTGSPPAGN